MAHKKLILILNASQEFIRYSGTNSKHTAAEETRLFHALSDLYLPLLAAFESLENDKIPFKMGIVLSPTLCTLLSDAKIQQQYLDWLDLQIEFGEQEVKGGFDPSTHSTAQRCLAILVENKNLFLRYDCNLVKKFLEYHKKGVVELLATCGTDIFLPHYRDMPEIINAQVETGIHAFRNFFGRMPEGFWLPELGYCCGIEKSLSAYGINYTVLNAQSLLLAEKLADKGIFFPIRLDNALVAFSNAPKTDAELFGEKGYAANPVYRNQNCDAGFELPADRLSNFLDEGTPRYAIGYKYWNKGRITSAKDESVGVYDHAAAEKQCAADAERFLAAQLEKLAKAEQLLPDTNPLSLTITIDSYTIQNNWAEFPTWITCLFRAAAKTDGADFDLCRNLLDRRFEFQKIKPYYGAAGGFGYGEHLLSSKNSWMLRYVKKASERMIALAERFPTDTGLKMRLLNAAAKELLLAQSSCWAKMIENADMPEAAAAHFSQSIKDFTVVFDGLGANMVSTAWLTKIEAAHPIFSWLSYRIFNKNHK